MGLETIHIKNYKCIQDYKINLKQMNLLLGENGSGKTNILSAISYFYANMISPHPSYDIFDDNNPLNDQVEITLTYDLGRLLMRSRKNQKEGKKTYQAYYKMMEGMSENHKFSLTMLQEKGGKITWTQSIDKRKIIYHMYPLYKLDTRKINLADWEELWKDIGDLIKPDSKESEVLHGNIKTAMQTGSVQLKSRLELLEEEFDCLQIKPVKFSVGEFAANMAQTYYGGRKFSYSDHGLNVFSDGTNSYNYIRLMLYVLSVMGRSKMKEPIFLMDEPELSLHYHLIDELADEIFICVDDITVLAATHSSRLVKNMLVKEQGNTTVYQVYKRGKYSHLCLLHMFSGVEKRERVFLTEHHANAFFAKLLILVEGETELELLSNSFLRILFPVLKEAEIIKGMSDKVIYRIVDTTARHYNVPMAALLDMDKILMWDATNNRMFWKKEYQFVSEREKYYYGSKREKTIPRRMRIKAMCSKCRFSYRLPFFGSEDYNYLELIRIIQKYYQNYNIFPVKTTIEGVLVNENNYQMVIQFLKNTEKYTGKWKSVENAFGLLYNETDKINFMRLLFHGKSDLLMKVDEICKYNTKIYQELKQALKSQAIGKTDWVSEWLKFYFANRTGIPIEKMTEKQFAKWCQDTEKRNKLRNKFSMDFFELFEFIVLISRLYRKNML